MCEWRGDYPIFGPIKCPAEVAVGNSRLTGAGQAHLSSGCLVTGHGKVCSKIWRHLGTRLAEAGGGRGATRRSILSHGINSKEP